MQYTLENIEHIKIGEPSGDGRFIIDGETVDNQTTIIFKDGKIVNAESIVTAIRVANIKED